MTSGLRKRKWLIFRVHVRGKTGDCRRTQDIGGDFSSVHPALRDVTRISSNRWLFFCGKKNTSEERTERVRSKIVRLRPLFYFKILFASHRECMSLIQVAISLTVENIILFFITTIFLLELWIPKKKTCIS